MKKLLYILTILLAFSCSKDDDNTTNDEPTLNNNYYTFRYANECYGQSVGSFCVSVTEYENAMDNKVFVDDVCFQLRLENEDGDLEFYIFSSATLGCVL